VAVESLDLSTLGIDAEPIGARMWVAGQRVTIAAVTRGVRPFTQTPYVFAELSEARRLTRFPAGAVTYWIADLRDPACAAAVVAHATAHPDLDAHTTAEFVRMTRRFWVESSGVGAVLELGALLSLVVGMVVIAQTLSAITRSHLRELGTLKALGASSAELIRFVAWQAALLAVVGGLLALGLAYLLRSWLLRMGLEIVLSTEVVAIGLTAIVAMCALASVGSMRTVLALDPAEVLR
jgi:putative ABC transport system permease protein